MLFRRRSILSLASRVATCIDDSAIAVVREKYSRFSRSDRPWIRFLDYRAELAREAFRCHKFSLDGSAPGRVLDLGTGPGYFLLACRELGHEAIGLDIADPILGDIAAAVGADRRICRVTPELSGLPVRGPFDLVTGFQIAFDNTYVTTDHPPWSTDDWRQFLVRVCNDILSPSGRLILTGVRSCLPKSPYYCGGTHRFLEAAGARVRKGCIELQNGAAVRSLLR
ncbi:MAG: class I SAM-dependent methyltransferase [Planctomycetota bacterium]